MGLFSVIRRLNVVLCVFMLPIVSWAQTSTGVITGRVLDPQEAAVVGAEVTLIQETTGVRQSTVTQSTGDFVFPSVMPGRYTLQVRAEGFKEHTQTGLILTASERLSVGTIRLQIGNVTETVTVTAEAPAIQLASQERSAVLDDRQIALLSTPGRDYFNMLKLLPGVAYPDGQGAQTLGTSSPPVIHGIRTDYIAINLDGVVANNRGLGTTENMVNLDAVAEVKVLMGNYQAEYGKNAGAIINVVTKSGTREFHGAAYWYKRHEMFNANGFFNNLNGLPKSRYRYATVGYNLGGPVFWPGKFNTNRDKVFFFFSQEIQPNKTPGGPNYFTVPTELERKGDFSQSVEPNGALIVVKDPLAGAKPFPGNVIPSSRINPDMQRLLNVFPLPNFFDRTISKGNYNLVLSDWVDRPVHQELLRLDVNPSEKWRVFFRGMYMRVKQDGRAVTANSNTWGIKQTYETTNPNLGLNVTWFPSPRWVNELALGQSRWTEIQNIRPEELARLQRDKLGIGLGQFNPRNNPLNLIPAASFGGVTNAASIGYDGRFPMDNFVNAASVADNVTRVWGAHTVKFGVYYEYAQYLQRHHGSNFAGSFNFGRTSNNPFDTNHPYANALLGYFQSYTEVNARVDYHPVNHVLEWFVQDNWKVNRKLTLDYGVRFTYDIPQYLKYDVGGNFDAARYNRAAMPLMYVPAKDSKGKRVAKDPITGQLYPEVYIGYFVPNSGDPFIGTIKAGTPGYPRGFVESNGVLAAPRFGFAWDPIGDGKTAIRAGAGVYYNARPRSGQMGDMAFNPPVQYTTVQFYGNVETFLQATGLMSPLSFTRVLERNPKMLTIYQMSFGIQRQVGFNTVVDVAYAGNLGRHLGQTRNLNTVPPGSRFLPENIDWTTKKPLPDNFFRPYYGYASLPYLEFAGTSSYHSLQVQAKRRFSHGLQYSVAWTWSKAMNYGDSYNSGVASYYGLRFWNYGPAGYDRTHTLVGNWVWDIPKLSHRVNNPLVRWICDDWQMSGIFAFVSGAPEGVSLSLADGADITGGGDGTSVVMTGKAILPKNQRTFYRFFDTSVFQRPPVGSPGSGAAATRYAFRGPGTNNWDLTFIKTVPVKERARLQFRWEMYNAFNHTQFSGVDTTARFDAAGNQINTRFGQLTSARSPRVQQLALRISF